MGDESLQQIYNYRRLSESIATAGQPSETELAGVATAGFDAVVNIALHDADYSLSDERALVESLGMRYVHIPVIWEKPTFDDLNDFFNVMDDLAGQRVFVHCAANKRVSVFLALYRHLRHGWSMDATLPDVLAIWEPDANWRQFMERAIDQYQKQTNNKNG